MVVVLLKVTMIMVDADSLPRGGNDCNGGQGDDDDGDDDCGDGESVAHGANDHLQCGA